MRLIDADELLKHKGNCYDINGHLLYAVGTGNIMAAKTIDPVKHGKWISVFIEYTDGSTGQRSECPFCNELQLIWSNYCPNCGARLDL